MRRRLIESSLHLFTNIISAPVLVVPCLHGVRSPVSDPRALLAGSLILGAVQNLLLAAHALGLGTVLTTVQMFFEATLREVLSLPEEAVPVAIIPVGFPRDVLTGRPRRRPIAELTYWDAWTQSGPAERQP